MSKKGKNQLTAKQSAFVAEYLIDLNATQAAIRAGYTPKGADVRGCKLLVNDKVAPHINKALEERAKRTEITKDQVLEEYAKLAFLNPKKFYNDEGDLIPIHLLPDDVAAALTGMDITTSFDKESKTFETIKKIKYSDKKGALDSVAKHLGMFIERKALVNTDGEDVLKDVLDAVKGVTRGLPNRTQGKIRE